MSLGYQNQASEWDYHCNTQDVNKGHIFPKCHTHDDSDANSTFTLTNAVPQVRSFNRGSWCKMENTVKMLMDNNCHDSNNLTRAYVVTGAVPSVGNLLKNRVNIPSLMWTAFCCYGASKQSWMSVAHWGLNEQEDDKTKTILSRSLVELYDMLNNSYPGASVFPDQCHNMTVNTDLVNSNLKEPTDDGDCCYEETDDDACDVSASDPIGTRQHTLLLFSVSAILIAY